MIFNRLRRRAYWLFLKSKWVLHLPIDLFHIFVWASAIFWLFWLEVIIDPEGENLMLKFLSLLFRYLIVFVCDLFILFSVGMLGARFIPMNVLQQYISLAAYAISMISAHHYISNRHQIIPAPKATKRKH